MYLHASPPAAALEQGSPIRCADRLSCDGSHGSRSEVVPLWQSFAPPPATLLLNLQSQCQLGQGVRRGVGSSDGRCPASDQQSAFCVTFGHACASSGWQKRRCHSYTRIVSPFPNRVRGTCHPDCSNAHRTQCHT